jgi:hypothetical protein
MANQDAVTISIDSKQLKNDKFAAELAASMNQMKRPIIMNVTGNDNDVPTVMAFMKRFFGPASLIISRAGQMSDATPMDLGEDKKEPDQEHHEDEKDNTDAMQDSESDDDSDMPNRANLDVCDVCDSSHWRCRACLSLFRSGEENWKSHRGSDAHQRQIGGDLRLSRRALFIGGRWCCRECPKSYITKAGVKKHLANDH